MLLVKYLATKDPRLGRLIERVNAMHGGKSLRFEKHSRPPLEALLRAIIGQQLSGSAAHTIFTRLIDIVSGKKITAEKVLAIPIETLRGIGASAQKTGFIRNVCNAVHDGTMNLDDLANLPDEDVMKSLQAINGIGRWTAEMYLIFHLKRPDVLPCQDIGIQRGLQIAYKLDLRPTPSELDIAGKVWAPHRTVASLYLWEAVDLRLSPEP